MNNQVFKLFKNIFIMDIIVNDTLIWREKIWELNSQLKVFLDNQIKIDLHKLINRYL